MTSNLDDRFQLSVVTEIINDSAAQSVHHIIGEASASVAETKIAMMFGCDLSRPLAGNVVLKITDHYFLYHPEPCS